MSYRDLYNTNKDFKEYVDKYCANFGIKVEKALEDLIVRVVAEKYSNDTRNKDGK